MEWNTAKLTIFPVTHDALLKSTSKLYFEPINFLKKAQMSYDVIYLDRPPKHLKPSRNRGAMKMKLLPKPVLMSKEIKL